MRKGIIPFLLVALFVLFCPIKVASQEASSITVNTHEVYKSVVILSIVKDKKAFDLTCNQGYPGCNELQSGKYTMVELPKNHGTYDCNNVEIFPDGADTEDRDKILGNYCMSAKGK